MARSSRRLRREDAGRVDEDDLGACRDGDAADERARRLHLVGDDRHLGADEAVEQRRLAGVGRADEGDEAAASVRVRRRSSAIGAARALPDAFAHEQGGSRPPARPRAWSVPSPAGAARPSTVTSTGRAARGPGPAATIVDRSASDSRVPCAHSCSSVLASAAARVWPSMRSLPVALDEARAPARARRRGRSRRSAPRRRRPRIAALLRPPRLRLAVAEADGLDRDRVSRGNRRRRSRRCTSAREAARELALVAVGKAANSMLGDDQAEHPVAEELQPLVVARARRSSCRRALAWVSACSEQLGDRRTGDRCGVLKRARSRRRRLALIDSRRCGPSGRPGPFPEFARRARRRAIEKKMISARPTKFSTGT